MQASRLTICLLHYRRPEAMRRVIEGLAAQTVKPILWLWNNSASPFHHPAIAWQVNTSHNVGCTPRWWMLSLAETEYVATWDDDMLPRDERVLADALLAADRHAEDAIVGRSGVVLLPDRPYRRCQHRPPREEDWAVDIVKGQFMVMRADVLRKHIRLGDLYQRPGEEDIVVSGCLAQGRSRPHLVPAILRRRIRQLPMGQFAVCKRPNHKKRRQQVRMEVFQRGAESDQE